MKGKVLTAESITHLHHSVGVKTVQVGFNRDGYLITTLVLVSSSQTLILMEGNPEDPPEVIGPHTMSVPGPLSQRTRAIKEIIDASGFVAAMLSGEYWRYPDETAQEDHEKLLLGQGPPPSGHPNRVEGAFVATTSPMFKVGLATHFDIDRTGDKPVLVNQNTVDESSGSGVIITGWLDELLPMGSKT